MKVKLNGEVVTVEASWAQGKHKVFKLTNGKTVLDLDKLIEAGKAEEVVEDSEKSWWEKKERLPKEDDDFEE